MASRLRGIAMMLAFPLAGALAQGPASPPAVDPSLAPYASLAHSVRLPGGRILHFTCAGHGRPTVILTDGAGGWGIHWARVQPAIAAQTRVCAWDRAGFGLSSPSPLPQTVDNTTADLEAGLARGGIAGPYILVGHSAAAYESLLLADRQPAKIVGMVLVDPALPDQTAQFARAAPAIAALPDPTNRALVVTLLRKCVAAIRAGIVRPGGPDPDQCLVPPPIPSDYPAALRAILTKQTATASPADSAAAEETIASYHASLEQDEKIVIAPHRGYGAMPLIVLTAGDYHLPTDAPQAARDEIPARQAVWRRGHEDYTALSTRGVHRIVAGSGHVIQLDKPQAVIDAVAELVDATRGPRPWIEPDSRHRRKREALPPQTIRL